MAVWQAGLDLSAFPCTGWPAARAGAGCFPPPDFSWSSSSPQTLGSSCPCPLGLLGS